jgi:hypothetical protein
MGVELIISECGRGFEMRVAGPLDETALIDAHREAFAEEDRLRGYVWALIDYAGADAINFTRAGMRTVIELDLYASAINPDILVAMIARKDAIYGIIRMWQGMAAGIPWQSEIFRNRRNAVAWLEKNIENRAIAGVSLPPAGMPDTP